LTNIKLQTCFLAYQPHLLFYRNGGCSNRGCVNIITRSKVGRSVQ